MFIWADSGVWEGPLFGQTVVTGPWPLTEARPRAQGCGERSHNPAPGVDHLPEEGIWEDRGVKESALERHN